MADEGATPSTTPTFANNHQVDTIESLDVVSSTPSFNSSELNIERVAVITDIVEKNGIKADENGSSAKIAPVVVAPAANVGKKLDFKVERAQITSKAKPKPKPKPKVVAPTPVAAPAVASRATTSTSNASNASTASSSVSSSDAMTRDSRSGVKKTYVDEKVELDTTSEGKGLSGVVAAAYKGVGSPYVWGGNTPSGWDCSGFVKWAYAQAGINTARGTSALLASGQFVKTSTPQPGDLVFQNGGGHVGIYVGDGQMIGAQNPTVDTILHSVDRNPLYGYYTLAK